jgi:hypothetical protein
MAELLLHSLAELREVIFPVAEIVRPHHIVEIGAESGRFSEELVQWCAGRGARLTTLDPSPEARVREIAAASPGVHHLIEQPSLAALPTLPAAQLYIIDGDHNYYTVSRELEHIDAAGARAGVPPVFVLHDVGWPWARRDLYYQPANIPLEHRHPHTYELGFDIDRAEPVAGGFRSNGAYAAATREGGERNGVLTAVEDFIAAHPGYRLFRVPAVFGLGVLFSGSHPQAAPLAELLRFYDGNPLIERLEQNRLRNYLRVLALQDEMAALRSENARLAKPSGWFSRLGAQLDRLLGR